MYMEKKILILLVLVVQSFSMQAQSAGMVPETSVIIVNESDREASINVKNTDEHTSLLYSQILPIQEDDENIILLTPPVSRVDAGETQAIRFILQTNTPLSVQKLRRVTFEGIPPKSDSNKAQVRINVVQNLPVIINPKDLAKDDEPWKRLKWTANEEFVEVGNPDRYVVRLDQKVVLNPGGYTVELPKTYILPGEKIKLNLSRKIKSISTVTIFPATVYGYSVDSYTVNLNN